MSAAEPAVEDPLALQNQTCFALVVASRSVLALYRPILEPLELTHPQYLVMLALWQHAPLSVKELSALLQLDPGTLSPLLKRLEAADLVRRERNTTDERQLAVSLTQAGRDLRARAEQVPHQVVARLGLDLEELRQLNVALNQIIYAANSAMSSAPGPA
ncbi:MarR family transcriptional regulator [Frankia sp. CNm7]|uniref:MarR family winged helix-turn-helix transcriptional regulator n=1 Tax=Frankia nepalensis TaxID=1836974 RepID=UPI001D7C02C7|nr:MarR family transcriptional regulator [Frankia nepalensis]MBL7514524.1 MarR family transcriptional regulator [Frankia nepalensis]MBL7524190.1 MarR family transcriptional regulator [Frankia nepalensis]